MHPNEGILGLVPPIKSLTGQHSRGAQYDEQHRESRSGTSIQPLMKLQVDNATERLLN